LTISATLCAASRESRILPKRFTGRNRGRRRRRRPHRARWTSGRARPGGGLLARQGGVPNAPACTLIRGTFAGRRRALPPPREASRRLRTRRRSHRCQSSRAAPCDFDARCAAEDRGWTALQPLRSPTVRCRFPLAGRGRRRDALRGGLSGYSGSCGSATRASAGSHERTSASDQTAQ
jgi:hypothetical protein